jgi:hypothetical protein
MEGHCDLMYPTWKSPARLFVGWTDWLESVLRKDKQVMPPSEKKERSECATCGYAWVTGTSGDHSCSEILARRLKYKERDYVKECRVIDLLVAGGFVSRSKVDEARQLLSDMP